MKSIEELKLIATQVRRDILRMTNSAKSGHPGGSLGCADFMVAMYFNIMKHNPKNFTIEGENEDVFILSNGHISPVWYSVLARSGYFDIKELSTFRKLGSRLQGHPCVVKGCPGVRIATGSLGQGLSVAIGIAIAKKKKNDNSFVYCLTGDGELQEGQIWEALLFASHNKVDNLVCIVDWNNKQIDGNVSDVLSLGDLEKKFQSFDWLTFKMNGNEMEDILKTMEIVKSHTRKGKPVAVLMKTLMGYGVDFMLDNHKWHGTPPNDEQLAKALAQLPETIGDY